MKKYNLSNIMKRAWKLVKESGMTLSAGLKKAWKEAKAVLLGTPKQVAWAEDIRNNAMQYVKDSMAAYSHHPEIMAGLEFVENRFRQLFEQHNEARYYIEHRNFYSRANIREKVNSIAVKYGQKNNLAATHIMG